MGVVYQESFLSNISIAENTRMGKPDATRSALDPLDKSLLALALDPFVTGHYPPGRVVVTEGGLGDRPNVIVRGTVGVDSMAAAGQRTERRIRGSDRRRPLYEHDRHRIPTTETFN